MRALSPVNRDRVSRILETKGLLPLSPSRSARDVLDGKGDWAEAAADFADHVGARPGHRVFIPVERDPWLVLSFAFRGAQVVAPVAVST